MNRSNRGIAANQIPRKFSTQLVEMDGPKTEQTDEDPLMMDFIDDEDIYVPSGQQRARQAETDIGYQELYEQVGNMRAEMAAIKKNQEITRSIILKFRNEMTSVVGRILNEVKAIRIENHCLKTTLDECIQAQAAQQEHNLQQVDIDAKLDSEQDLDIEVDQAEPETTSLDAIESDSDYLDEEEEVVPKAKIKRSGIKISMTKRVLPQHPFTTVEDFLQFEEDLAQNDDVHIKMVRELLQYVDNSNPDKYIRECWRKIMTDDTAINFSWKGTQNKHSIREMTTTTLIRIAFQRKFKLKEDIARVSQKYFQYVNDKRTRELNAARKSFQ